MPQDTKVAVEEVLGVNKVDNHRVVVDGLNNVDPPAHGIKLCPIGRLLDKVFDFNGGRRLHQCPERRKKKIFGHSVISSPDLFLCIP